MNPPEFVASGGSAGESRVIYGGLNRDEAIVCDGGRSQPVIQDTILEKRIYLLFDCKAWLLRSNSTIP